MEQNSAFYLKILRKNYGELVDNCLENPLAPSHISELKAFPPLYFNHKRKTHQTSWAHHNLGFWETAHLPLP